jgi:hypothetical protein
MRAAVGSSGMLCDIACHRCPTPNAKGYSRGITSVSIAAAASANAVPVMKSVQVFGRIAPSITITKRIGMSRKCVGSATQVMLRPL